MKLFSHRDARGLRLGAFAAGAPIDVEDAAGALGAADAVPRLETLYATGSPALAPLADLVREVAGREGAWQLDPRTLRYGACVPAPGKIVCVGLNYAKHARESGLPLPETPVLFSKFGNAVAGPDDVIPVPRAAHEVDYEAELVVVMGRRARDVTAEEALGYVLGYCNGNDLSARDLQRKSSQWLLGKTLDGFLPLGPWLVTRDDVPDPQDLEVRCWLNGELRQESSTADMIFGVAEVIRYVSEHLTLEPGDVIATGTPEGVILGRSEKVWMKSGDEVTVEVGPLGRLTNRLA